VQNTEEEGGGRRRLGGGGEAHCLWTGEMVVSGGSELSEVVGKNTAQKREQKSPSSEALDDPSHPTRGWMTHDEGTIYPGTTVMKFTVFRVGQGHSPPSTLRTTAGPAAATPRADSRRFSVFAPASTLLSIRLVAVCHD
jgi:hypothetical protein